MVIEGSSSSSSTHDQHAAVVPVALSEVQLSEQQHDNNNNNNKSSPQENDDSFEDDENVQTIYDTTAVGNGLNVGQAASLLTADILGTGLLALPNNVAILGHAVGLTILILFLPINWWAGHFMACAADGVDDNDNNNNRDSLVLVNSSLADVEGRQGPAQQSSSIDTESSSVNHTTIPATTTTSDNNKSLHRRSSTDKRCHGVETVDKHSVEEPTSDSGPGDSEGGIHHHSSNDPEHDHQSTEDPNAEDEGDGIFHDDGSKSEDDTLTNDLINMTKALFSSSSSSSSSHAVAIVRTIFYANIFLVLGDYMLVMAHAVSAIFDDEICMPHAGLIAAVSMFGLTQIRQLRDLGRFITFISLASLAIVVVQCLVAAHTSYDGMTEETSTSTMNEAVSSSSSTNTATSILRKLSAVASISFATGSNKLLLNVRHEMAHRVEASRALFYSMLAFGAVYVGISVLAGSHPPGFLFDAIPEGTTSRRIAGFLLWIHISVSYSINSQAICASIDQLVVQRQQQQQQQQQRLNSSSGTGSSSSIMSPQRRRWLGLTFTVAVSSYLVANAVPFFKDLVALIGSLTAIPLSIILPAMLHRKFHHYPLFSCRASGGGAVPYGWPSCGLVTFGFVALTMGLIGALGSIALDWEHTKQRPFACSAE